MSDEVERLLSEAAMSDDEVLRTALVRLRDDATSERPVPSPELSKLLGRRQAPSVLRRHRGTLTALIVIGAVGAGVTAAAASPAVRSGVQHVFEVVTGAGEASPVPPAVATQSPSPAPAETVDPVDDAGETATDSPPPPAQGVPTSHPTTGVGNGAPKPTHPGDHPTQGANGHSADPSPGHSQEHRP